jgi:hypothetical protein
MEDSNDKAETTFPLEQINKIVEEVLKFINLR